MDFEGLIFDSGVKLTTSGVIDDDQVSITAIGEHARDVGTLIREHIDPLYIPYPSDGSDGTFIDGNGSRYSYR